MGESDFRYEHATSVKTHEEIMSLIEEIKEMEKKFDEIRIDHETKEEIAEQKIVEELEEKPIPFKIEVEEPKKKFAFKLKRPKKATRQEQFATFRLRIDESGKLVNIDLRRSEPKEKGRFSFSLKGLIKRREKTNENREITEETKGIGSKLKTLLSKLGKLKSIIPGKVKE